jgi:hypothetical protein
VNTSTQMVASLSALHIGQPPSAYRKIPGTQRLSRHQGHSVAGRVGRIENFSNFLGNWNSQPCGLWHSAPSKNYMVLKLIKYFMH